MKKTTFALIIIVLLLTGYSCQDQAKTQNTNSQIVNEEDEISKECTQNDQCALYELIIDCCGSCARRDKSDDSFQAYNIEAFKEYSAEWDESHCFQEIQLCPECIGTITNNQHMIAKCVDNTCQKMEDPECVNTNCPEEKYYGF